MIGSSHQNQTTHIRLLAILLVCLTLTACKLTEDDDSPQDASAQCPSKPSNAGIDKIAIDRSTPDRALKSYWALKDAISVQQGLQWNRAAMEANASMDRLGLAASPEIVAEKMVLRERGYRFERELLEVRAESETRAVASARMRNITPVPTGITLSEAEQLQRLSWHPYRYVLGKDQKGWRVEEIWEGTDNGQSWVRRAPAESKAETNNADLTSTYFDGP
ncbi:MAG: hypothetical protein E6Q76_14295 [Rhizobium sp.]|nr:MAG: hypothetical protein E6Q76_14295 [Rhizobium sp.]